MNFDAVLGIWGIWVIGYRSMGHMVNGVQGYGVWGTWAIGVMGQWSTGGIGTWVMGCKGSGPHG